jgi:predicted GNAT family acetyltransferase
VESVTVIQAQPRVLNAADARAFRRLVSADPIVNCVLDGRIEAAPELDPQRLGGFVWGVDCPRAEDGLRAAAFHGGNLIPVGDDLDAFRLIGSQLARGQRGCSSIVGPAGQVGALWSALAPAWGPARAIRMSQPLLCSRVPASVAADPAVRAVHAVELDRFLPAAIAMFTEELEMSPVAGDSGRGYRNRVAELIRTGRAYARFDDRGRVMFKAEIGALSRATAQIQGVWVRPDLRGRGLGTACMAAVLRLALQRAQTVSLYVNSYNSTGRAMYERLGFIQLNTLRTVLF